ncbi:MAG: tRNA (adenosine(37)-N6)-dimethylallyltransferase MiaA [Thermomicrobiales bacterium]
MTSNNQTTPVAAIDQRWNDDLPRLVSIAGPTAVGKTALAIDLALEFDGEVINADSRYLYRGFDIGVAKPDTIERRGVPHHLIDVLPPTGDMSLARYQDLAYATIAQVHRRGRLPLLVGGTPLYLNAVIEGWRIPRVPPDLEFRAALETQAVELGVAALSDRLRAVDPVAADRCGRNLRRIIRALEIYEATGIPMSLQEGKEPPPFTTLEIGLTMPRDLLYRSIDDRVADQITRGLPHELRALLEGGVPENAPAMSSIGYRQLLPYLRGECDLDAAAARIRFDTHRYVRHQETWLRRNPRIQWFDVSQTGWNEAVISSVRKFLDQAEPNPKSTRAGVNQEPLPS